MQSGEPAPRARRNHLTAAVREIAGDAAAAALLPVVAFLIPFNAVVTANVNETLYHPRVAQAFLAASLLVWVVGIVIMRRLGGRPPARLWITLPWAILLLDVAGAALAGAESSLAVLALADAAILSAVVAVAVKASWPPLRLVAAVVATGLLIQGGVAHAAFLRDLRPELVAGSRTVESSVPTPPRDAPGDVYQLLLAAYPSEAVA